MANWKAGTSSDAVRASRCEYDVFLNFRGWDTRHNFTDFLYDRLVDAGVNTFRDEEKLPVGDVISYRLEHAINNSELYIPIFSRNYASSKWCLRELKLIMDNVSNSGDQKSIFPIFLLVKPDDVKLKIWPDSDAPYKAAFEEHEKKFPDEVEAWKTALGKVDERKGWVVKEDTSQAATVKSVVGKVLEKLKLKHRLVPEHLIGLDDQVKDLMEFLDVNHDDVRFIEIYGMGGIGKTTIAKVIFNQMHSHFGKCCSFIENVRERSITEEGKIQLQKKLLSDIGEPDKIIDSERGMRRIEAILCKKKVLIILDDLDRKESIKYLIGNSILNRGSRIIITTRNRDILQVEGSKIEQHEMQTLDDDLALQLFCWHAFCNDLPPDDYRELSRNIVSLVGGLPLGIEVVASLLKNKEDKKDWEELFVKLSKVPYGGILGKLRISYDDLDTCQKNIFLDIACFLFNEEKMDAIYMWESSDFYPREGIAILTKRCLIKILDNDKLWMHDLLIALGRQIVREESKDELEKQSRLWDPKEALQIIRTQERECKVQALQKTGRDDSIKITSEQFKKFSKLRLLKLQHGTYAGDFAECISNLRWFSWSFPPEKDFGAKNFYLHELVICKLFAISFKDDSKAWDIMKKAKKLKVLSISSCHDITSIPDISGCSALERLTLYCCYGLKRIESFIGDLRSLIELKIIRCLNIMDLPEEVGELVNLKHFSLFGCEELRELPRSLGNLTSLTKLDLSGTMIAELPNSIVQLKSLQILHFPLWSRQNQDSHDWQLPSGFDALVNLEELDLSRRNKMTGEIPVGIEKWSSLKILNLKWTKICRIPSTINKLHKLQTLDLTNCHKIQELPELPTSLTCLLLQSMSLLSVPNLSNLTKLVKLLLSNEPLLGQSKPLTGCDLRWIGNLSRLKKLNLHLPKVLASPELASLSHLEELGLKYLDLKPLVQVPSSNWRWRNLLTLETSCCEERIPFEGFSQLQKFTICHCVRLSRLSIPSKLRKLREVDVLGCSELVEIQVVGLSESLEYLNVYRCHSLTRISGLQYLKNLETLRIGSCNVLANVEDLNQLDSLKSLVAHFCPILRRLIDPSCTKIPNDCCVTVSFCGYFFKTTSGMSLKDYKEKILLSNKTPFTIIFHFGGKKSSERFEFVGGIKREKEGVNPVLVTYEGLVADVKSFGFCLKRMWYRYPHSLDEIKSDEDVNKMLEDASRQGFLIHLSVEGGVDSEWEGEYDEEMTEMLKKEQRMKTGVYSDEDEAKWWGYLSSDSNSDSAPMGGESETHGTSSVDIDISQIPLTIRFHLGVKWFSDEWGCIGGIEREKKGVDPNTVTYEGLIADVKNFGFRMKRMRCEVPRRSRTEINCDWIVKYVFRPFSSDFINGSLIHLLVEEEVDSEWEGEYDDEMMKMLGEQWRMKTDMCSNEDGAKGGASCLNEDSNSASVGGESESHGSSSVDDFKLERDNTECFEATTSIAEKNLDTVKNQVELHEESTDKNTITSKGCGEETFLNTLKKGKRQRDDDHASHTNTTTKKSTCGQQSGNPQQVTRRTRRQAAKKQPPVEAAALPVEAAGPSRKKKKNDSKQVNPIRRSARLMRGPTGGTSDIMHRD